MADTKRIYCSGPLFNDEERWMMSQIAETLEKAGYDTFLPHRDGLEMLAFEAAKAPGARSAVLEPASTMLQRAIFSLDIFQLVESCDAIVSNINGRVPDEGTLVEAAVAFSIGKPLVLFKNDERAPFGGLDNSMVTGLVGFTPPIRHLVELPRTVERALKSGGARKKAKKSQLSPQLKSTVTFGREVWRVLALLRKERGVVANSWSAIERLLGTLKRT